jgi:NAD(P)-dependent dehydrogenase (short-subunit alcohol dehydrogenase family)
MSHFEGSVAIVTGGASGIGQALCEQIAASGSRMVVLADIDAARARDVASALTQPGHEVRAAHVDVAQAADVQKLVTDTFNAYGRLDFMFNNAGIALCGEVRDLDLQHWRRVLDTNLWGVIYGTSAAYQVMVGQNSGHIVNTASLGGLIPEPMATPYAAAKHAVVGLSTSLRAEAAALGVKVSVVCPGFVRTRALEGAAYVGVKKQAAIEEMCSMNMRDATKCARAILQGVKRNRAIITDCALTRLMWRLYRLWPALLDPFLRKGAADIRALRVVSGDVS